ncbi:MAG: hypothetical protein KDB01_26115, partial [Planctomycetaceae bacterium]|nr:hypothetical protein [Planctomycetaceae bacterium]
SQERKNGASPQAAVEAFREAMAEGRFQTALNCMTEDARNEWLGEMLIAYRPRDETMAAAGGRTCNSR